MFNGLYFSYDGVQSEWFGIKILDFDGTGKFETNILSADIRTAKPARSRKFYRVGSLESDPMPFTLSVVSETALSDTACRAILSWLYNRNDFKEFRVSQPDMDHYYYKALFNNVDKIFISGHCHGFVFSGLFDSRYAYGEPTTATTTSTLSIASLTIANDSDDLDGFVYPKITIKAGSTGTASPVSIYESTARFMSLTQGIQANETLTIDCERKTIKSDKRSYPISKFSGTWLRLAHGNNSPWFSGFPINTTFTVECPRYVLIGF